MKMCNNCSFENYDEKFTYCPICGSKLNKVGIGEDGTLDSPKFPCLINDENILRTGKTYYYKMSPVDREFVWIYDSENSKRFIIGCHISKITPIKDNNDRINNIDSDKITIEEFIKEVWEVEHIKIDVNFNDGLTHLVDHYPYKEPMDGDCTVDDLFLYRIQPVLGNNITPNTIILLHQKEK